ncbi:NDMA-dependent alcohol dehydrogenase [Frankia sp. CNm7]|uniref:NDMA-dependent alcohol dehydrogenase n=1 Tax=Frankia nepalensis TaxID=1836974 RepID=A0A937RK96_9ACTN|nr:NDMA-dependent alcohol dehydrogenase [Frankia nepalensis]MBL7499421.1 NDMA-dependent alcohol dehydrogenase [Frankia nepalensis]MBL7515441.1 NDMA-dependent alcohol dehydrogenase [Frankia nepalensis]MBL7518399.1 NDMA-dependent alcohol dehydrogenase [Frankia nepalensis]MBL7631827.1 NDMA-dependent alcohol dehydrogenase [Frankia nepalensis]
MVSTRAALLFGPGQDYKIETVELDEPRAGEVLVQMKATGLCHSDEHARTGDMPMPHYPVICGHEGAAEVVAVGEGVTSVAPGDHVAMSFIPSCGVCPPCRSGRAYICDLGAKLFDLGMITDGRVAHRYGDEPVARYSQLGTFSEYQLLAESSVVKVDRDIPWTAVALVSCGVATGFGSVVNRAEVKAGDTVAVLGVGGIGINAVQGAKIAGASRIIAVDPVEFKREQAVRFGATHTFASLDEAIAGVGGLTAGRMCDAVICTFGVMLGNLLEPALTLTAKGGTCVITSVAPMVQAQADVNLFMLAMMNKDVRGCLYGSQSPRVQIPRLLDLYRAGILKIDELVTKTYSLDQVNEGYADLEAGRIVRGALVY